MTGTKQVAQRIVNAEENFIETLMEIAGINREDAAKAMATMLKLKVAKLDAVIGRITVKHGAYLEASAIHNAVAFKK